MNRKTNQQTMRIVGKASLKPSPKCVSIYKTIVEEMLPNATELEKEAFTTFACGDMTPIFNVVSALISARTGLVMSGISPDAATDWDINYDKVEKMDMDDVLQYVAKGGECARMVGKTKAEVLEANGVVFMPVTDGIKAVMKIGQECIEKVAPSYEKVIQELEKIEPKLCVLYESLLMDYHIEECSVPYDLARRKLGEMKIKSEIMTNGCKKTGFYSVCSAKGVAAVGKRMETKKEAEEKAIIALYHALKPTAARDLYNESVSKSPMGTLRKN